MLTSVLGKAFLYLFRAKIINGIFQFQQCLQVWNCFYPLITWRKLRPLQAHPTKQNPTTTQNSWNCPCWQNTETAHQLRPVFHFLLNPSSAAPFRTFHTHILALAGRQAGLNGQTEILRQRSACANKRSVQTNRRSPRFPHSCPGLCLRRIHSWVSRSASLENFQIFQFFVYPRELRPRHVLRADLPSGMISFLLQQFNLF